MADDGYLERLERWADQVVADSAELPEDLTDEELREREALWYADFFTLQDGWLIAGPDDPAMRDRLIQDEGMTGDRADDVLAKMRELGATRVGP
jgi:hypothetical protein